MFAFFFFQFAAFADIRGYKLQSSKILVSALGLLRGYEVLALYGSSCNKWKDFMISVPKLDLAFESTLDEWVFMNRCFNYRNGSTIVDVELEKKVPVSQNTTDIANTTAAEFEMKINKEIQDAQSGLLAGAMVDIISSGTPKGWT